MELKEIILDIFQEVKKADDFGQVASYIPELGSVNPNNFGVFISTVEKDAFGIGDYTQKFSIQSISKVLSFALAYINVGEAIWDRVNVEPSGTSFDSLIQLEADKGIPRNPLINSGAIVIADILLSELKNPRENFLGFLSTLTECMDIGYSKEIARSEKKTGYRNIALCNFIKSLGNLENEPDDVLDFYFDLCSITMNCRQLTEVFMFLANQGRRLSDNKQVVTRSQTKRINSMMHSCGLYDESGEFSFKVGLPGKSSISGAVVAVHPKNFCVAVWSPKLNEKGNSNKGIFFLEKLTTKTELSIF